MGMWPALFVPFVQIHEVRLSGNEPQCINKENVGDHRQGFGSQWSLVLCIAERNNGDRMVNSMSHGWAVRKDENRNRALDWLSETGPLFTPIISDFRSSSFMYLNTIRSWCGCDRFSNSNRVLKYIWMASGWEAREPMTLAVSSTVSRLFPHHLYKYLLTPSFSPLIALAIHMKVITILPYQ